MMNFNKLIKSQIKNPKTIPIIIINFNQLFYLKQLVQFLLNRKFENIIIIDNNSTYPPLLEYYKEMDKKLKIEQLNENLGHMVLYKKKELFDKYCKGFYCLTDADIVPNQNLPKDFLSQMIKVLIKNITKVNKVGFALKIDNIPDTYAFKEKVLQWESRWWNRTVAPNVYVGKIDTTFALYSPSFFSKDSEEFLKGLRLAENFEAKHGGWYVDFDNLSEEQDYYYNTATNASSWKPIDGVTTNKLYENKS